MNRLVLASGSPRRIELLKECNIDFVKVRHNFDEKSINLKNPVMFAKALAEGKAESIALLKEYKDDFILGVDTIVVHKNKIFGKPENSIEAEKFIRYLSNNKHEVITGISVINLGKSIKITEHACSIVHFNKFSEKFIKYYLDNNHWEGYSGGYAIQGIFSLVVKKITGSYTNIVGLPLELLYKILNQIRFDLFF